MNNWKWFGFPGHHICASRCVFHLTTVVNDKYMVSTVGHFVPDPIKNPYKTDTVGFERDFETMVFEINGYHSDGHPKVIDWGNSLRSRPYNNSSDANDGHLDICQIFEKEDP